MKGHVAGAEDSPVNLSLTMIIYKAMINISTGLSTGVYYTPQGNEITVGTPIHGMPGNIAN